MTSELPTLGVLVLAVVLVLAMAGLVRSGWRTPAGRDYVLQVLPHGVKVFVVLAVLLAALQGASVVDLAQVLGAVP